jgi:hypothetical protein
LARGRDRCFVVCLRENIAAGKRHVAKRAEFEAPFEKRMQDIEQLMKKTREIVDDR